MVETVANPRRIIVGAMPSPELRRAFVHREDSVVHNGRRCRPPWHPENLSALSPWLGVALPSAAARAAAPPCTPLAYLDPPRPKAPPFAPTVVTGALEAPRNPQRSLEARLKPSPCTPPPHHDRRIAFLALHRRRGEWRGPGSP